MAETDTWDSELEKLLTSPDADVIRIQRAMVECLEIADDFLHWQDYYDAETGEQVPGPPEHWIHMASTLIATGIWLGLRGLDDPDMCRADGGHLIVNRLKRLRNALP